jgi:hypothetical protein
MTKYREAIATAQSNNPSLTAAGVIGLLAVRDLRKPIARPSYSTSSDTSPEPRCVGTIVLTPFGFTSPDNEYRRSSVETMVKARESQIEQAQHTAMQNTGIHLLINLGTLSNFVVSKEHAVSKMACSPASRTMSLFLVMLET